MANFTGPTNGRTVKIEGDDSDLADLIDGLVQEQVRVELPNGDVLRFETARERLCWVDGFRANRSAERVLATLEASLNVVEAADEETREEAVAYAYRLDSQLTQDERCRKNKITERFKSWHRGSTTRSSTVASAPQ